MNRTLLCLTTALGLTLGLLPGWAPALLAQEGEAPGMAESPGDLVDAGAFLAARNAEASGDFRNAAAWFSQAQLADPTNADILDGAIFANLALGNITPASSLAKQRLALGAGSTSGEKVDTQVADFAVIADEALRGDYEAILKSLADGRSIGPLVDALASAWSLIGLGQMNEGLAEFDKLAKTRGLEPYGLYHKALALALAGDFEGADKILSGKVNGQIGLNRRGIIAHAQILSQLERNPEAVALLDKVFGQEGEPEAEVLRARLVAGEPVPFDILNDPREGLAESFFSLASLLSGEADPAYTLINLRVAIALQPSHVDAVLLAANTLEQLGEYELAEEIYATFSAEHPAYYHAQLGRANALYQADRKVAALEVLRELVQTHGGLLQVQAAYADLLRREESWAEADAAYSAAIALLADPPPGGAWVLYFSRAITKERRQMYDQADVDFRTALTLNPDRPEVLNYLGYSMIERGKDLEEALGLIKQAVKAEPEAGYIVDSLAWGYFMLGRYEEALAPMEKASLLEPVDPVVTDHLGDVYWMNGRQREARFQWHRALSFKPVPEEAARIRRKLDLGLDAVMAEEKRNPRPKSGPEQPPEPEDEAALAPQTVPANGAQAPKTD